jgi:hypothetical protein
MLGQLGLAAEPHAFGQGALYGLGIEPIERVGSRA